MCLCVCVRDTIDWILCSGKPLCEDLSLLCLVLRCVVRWLDMGVDSSRTSTAITNPLTLVQDSSALPSWLAFRISEEAFDCVQCLCHMLHCHSSSHPFWMSGVAVKSIVSLHVTFRRDVYAVVNVKYWPCGGTCVTWPLEQGELFFPLMPLKDGVGWHYSLGWSVPDRCKDKHKNKSINKNCILIVFECFWCRKCILFRLMYKPSSGTGLKLDDEKFRLRTKRH
jgi:hypothetical protein